MKKFKKHQIIPLVILVAIIIAACIYYWPQNYGSACKNAKEIYIGGVVTGDENGLLEHYESVNLHLTGDDVTQFVQIMGKYHYCRSLKGSIFNRTSFKNRLEGNQWSITIFESSEQYYTFYVGDISGSRIAPFFNISSNEEMFEEIYEVFGSKMEITEVK